MSEYKRLTRYVKTYNDGFREYANKDMHTSFYIINKLGLIEDKICNGTLVELPCKVGQECYRILCDENENFKIVTLVVEGIAIFENTKMIYTNENCVPYREDEFGDIIFFDKAEAEKRLAELKGEVK